MINQEEYYNAVKKYFNFLVERYDFFELDKKFQNTMLYDVEYADKNNVISISYEIMGEGVNIVIFKILNNKRSDYDDYVNTIHLNRIMESSQRKDIIKHLKDSKSLFKYFEKPESKVEEELLKKAVLLCSVMMTSILNN